MADRPAAGRPGPQRPRRAAAAAVGAGRPRRERGARARPADPSGRDHLPDSADLLTDDILPGWDEDWLQLERERHRQLRIHALEALSRRLTAAGRFGAAIDVAYRAIAAEPLRESAWCALIRAHLAEGNRSVASHQLGEYRRLLADELGLDPSEAIEALLTPATDGRRSRA